MNIKSWEAEKKKRGTFQRNNWENTILPNKFVTHTQTHTHVHTCTHTPIPKIKRKEAKKEKQN